MGPSLHTACHKGMLWGPLLLPVENLVGITPNPAASHSLCAWASLAALGRGEPAWINWMQTRGCAQPLCAGWSYFGCRVYRPPGMQLAGAACRHARLCRAALHGGAIQRRAGGGGEQGAPVPGAAEEREVLFLGSCASSPSHSLPVNLMEMTNGAGGFGLAPSRGAEQGLHSPSGRVIPTGGQWGAMLRSSGESRGIGLRGHQGPSGGSAQTGELQAWCRGCWLLTPGMQRRRDGGAAAGLACSLGISSMAMGARGGASSTGWQLGGAGHAASLRGSGAAAAAAH